MRSPTLLFVVSLLAGCSSKTSEPTPADPVAKPMSAHDEALAAQDRLSKLGNKAIVMAAVEKNESDSQIVKLEKIANEVEELMAAGELDRAEIVASGLRWQPDPTRSKISESEAELIKQYDERRATMQRVIESALSRKTL